MRAMISVEEIAHISVSVVAIALALTFHEAKDGLGVAPAEFTYLMSIFMITVGSGFILHELAHKFVAMRYGAWAEFRAWPLGLVVLLGMAVLKFPFLFLAPGAVYIFAPHITKEQNGIISVAGPVTNLLIAFGFGLVYVFSGDATIMNIAGLGIMVNGFLAFFNMLPIFPLDGSKVFAWNRLVWLLVTGIAVLIAF